MATVLMALGLFLKIILLSAIILFCAYLLGYFCFQDLIGIFRKKQENEQGQKKGQDEKDRNKEV